MAERRFDAANAPTGGLNFHYDGEEAAHEAELNAAGAVTGQRWTTHSDGVDDLLAVTLPVGATGTVSPTATTSGPAAPSNASFYYHTDHQGSVRAITDGSGAVVNSYAYDSYGTAQESVESLAQRFRYTGREYDGLTGLYHYRARAFDPETARFLQEDPLWFEGGDLNIYGYVGQNPVNLIDPSGTFAGNAGDYAAVAGISTRVLTAGRMATQFMLSTGARTARYLRTSNKAVLSAIAGTLACTMFTLADVFAKSGPNSKVVGVDATQCAAVAMSVPDEESKFDIPTPNSPEWCVWVKEECIRECSEIGQTWQRKFIRCKTTFE